MPAGDIKDLEDARSRSCVNWQHELNTSWRVASTELILEAWKGWTLMWVETGSRQVNGVSERCVRCDLSPAFFLMGPLMEFAKHVEGPVGWR